MQGNAPAADDAAMLDDVFSRDSTGTPAPVEDKGDGLPRDDRGRFAPKEAPAAPPPAQPQAEAQPPPPPSPEPVDPDANRQVQVSLAELKAERAKRQEKDRLYIEAVARASAYEQQIQQLLQRQHAPAPRQPEPQPEPPDPLTDPEGFRRYVVEQAQERSINAFLDLPKSAARRHYGAAVVNAAEDAAIKAGLGSQFMRAEDPYDAVVTWHKRQQAMAEVGDDLDAFKKRVEDEVRQKVLAELKAGGASPMPPQRFPGSLAAATNAAGPGGAPVAQSDGAMLDGVFDTNRKHR